MVVRLLLVEDDPVIGHNVKDALEAEGYVVELAPDSHTATEYMAKGGHNLLILDVNLPDGSGFDLCKRFRAGDTATPVLMLTAYDDLDDKVQGFASGADDYLTKPFFMRELLMRVQALLKRSANNPAPSNQQMLVAHDLKADLRDRRVYHQGREVVLTPREFQVLVRLMRANGELVTKQELVREIWGSVFDANTNTIEVYINFLRNKVDRPFGTNLIRTRIGYGYFLSSEP